MTELFAAGDLGGGDATLPVTMKSGRAGRARVAILVDATGTAISAENPLPIAGGGGGGGGGGAVTVADGADVSQGARADAAYGGTGAGTVVAILKGMFALLTTNGRLGAGVDRSGSITAANTGQQVAAANTSRRAMAIQNTSSGDLFVNEVGQSAGAAGSAGTYTIPAGATFTVKTTSAVSIRGGTVGQTYTATESS